MTTVSIDALRQTAAALAGSATRTERCAFANFSAIAKRASVAILAATVMLATAATARAQEPIETDRPDQTETATTVPAGSVQIEAGFVYEHDEAAYDATFGGDATLETTAMQMPTALVRIGLAERFELRLESGVQSIETRVKGSLLPVEETTSMSGMTPLAVGFKVELLEEEGAVPQMAFIGDITLPLGDEALQSEHVAPAFRFTMANTLADWLSLGYNLGAEWDGNDPNGVGIYTVTLAAALSETLGAYVEAFGEMSTGATPMHMLDGGFTFKPVPNFQLDLSGGIALNEASPDYYIGAGASVRLPQ